MAEMIIGILKNVQAKGMGSLTVKNCDLYITDKRLVCIVLSSSSMVAGMMGSAAGGPSAAIAYASATELIADDKRAKMMGKEIDAMIAACPGSYLIMLDDIDAKKSSFKTGFFSTLGVWAPLTVWTVSGERNFFNIPNADKALAKAIIEKATGRIKTS